MRFSITGGSDVIGSAERAPFVARPIDRLAVGVITVANSPDWVRAPQHDRRISRGDDFAGDAWMDRQTGTIRYVVVGQSPGGENPVLPFQAKASEDNGATGRARDETPADRMAGEASRVDAGRTASATSEHGRDGSERRAPNSPSRSLTSSQAAVKPEADPLLPSVSGAYCPWSVSRPHLEPMARRA